MAETIEIAAKMTGRKARVETAPYFTDEYCLTARIHEAEAIFTEIARRWCGI